MIHSIFYLEELKVRLTEQGQDILDICKQIITSKCRSPPT